MGVSELFRMYLQFGTLMGDISCVACFSWNRVTRREHSVIPALAIHVTL